MVAKKTLFLRGSMCRSTHLTMLLSPVLYAASVSIRVMFFMSPPNGPRLQERAAGFQRKTETKRTTTAKEEKRGVLQDLHGGAGHPPEIGVEDDDVSALPVAGVPADVPCADDPVGDSVDDGVVGVGLHEERRPVELHGGVVLLRRRRSGDVSGGGEEEEGRKPRRRVAAAGTLARKTVRESKVSMDLAPSGMARLSRHAMEENWPLFSESPTKSILFPRSISSRKEALNLRRLGVIRRPLKVCWEEFLCEGEPGEGAAAGLPPPVLVAPVGAAVLLAGELRLNVWAFLLLVQRAGGLVVDPLAGEEIALRRRLADGERPPAAVVIVLYGESEISPW